MELTMLAVVIFLNGLCVMILEMAGARLLAPWLGTSIIVWTSIIGVILASLSLGNWVGGRLGDSLLNAAPAGKKKDSQPGDPIRAALPRALSTLSHLFAGAALSVLLCALSQSFVLETVSAANMPLHTATLVVTTALFALPSFLCGMISPFITRIAIVGCDTPGAIIGKLGAIATLGSIAGTFLGGFFLIAWFGTTSIIFGIAICMLGASVLVWRRALVHKAVVGALVVLALLFQYSLDEQARAAGATTIETRYNTIRIFEGRMEGRPMRLLQTDPGSYQSGMYMDDPADLAFPYTRFYALGTLARPQAGKILMLGGGGYSVPKWLLAGKSGLERHDFTLDVVELDPGISRAAKDYFALPEDPRMSIVDEDARTFLNRRAGQNGLYDLIFTDIFNSCYTVPFHVGTVEAAKKMRALLAEDGLVVMNIISSLEGDNGRLLRGIYGAFAEVFPTVELYPVHYTNSPQMVQNVILVAGNRAEGNFAATTHPRLASLLANRHTRPLPDDIPPLRDNFAPVEMYTLGMAGR